MSMLQSTVPCYLDELAAQDFAITQAESYGQEIDPEDDPCDTPRHRYLGLARAGVSTLPCPSVEECRADAALAATEEHFTKVDRSIANMKMTPALAFSRAHDLLEQRSVVPREWSRYYADVYCACRHALRAEEMLWHLYQMIWGENGALADLNTAAIAKNAHCKRIIELCGQAIVDRGLENFYGEYLSRSARLHDQRGKFDLR
jgi:hypothetical protein